MEGLGFRVLGVGFRFQGSRFRAKVAQGLGGLGFSG